MAVRRQRGHRRGARPLFFWNLFQGMHRLASGGFLAGVEGLEVTMELAKFIRFIVTEIFPGGRLPMIEKVEEHSTKVGFKVTHVQSLQLDFARTLDFWAEALEARKDEAVALQSEEMYERYMKYLTGCAKGFRTGYIDCNQFTLQK